MENQLYVFYNTLSKRYGDVVAYPSDGFMLHVIQPKIAKEDLAVLEMCRIGSINIDTGVITPSSPVRVAWRIEENVPIDTVTKK